MGKIQWVEYNPEEYESSSEQELPYLFDLIPAGNGGKYDVRVFNKKEPGTYDAGDLYGSAYDEEQVADVLACDSLDQAKEAAEYYLKHGGFFEFHGFHDPLPRTSPPTADQFESVVDRLLKSSPQDPRSVGKQALRGPRWCRKPNVY